MRIASVAEEIFPPENGLIDAIAIADDEPLVNN
jgi:hypothetical protein